MTTTTPTPAPTERHPWSAAADVLVIFGITGDLARVMTFRSLYRLEKRGLLDCPIVGVAVDDWSLERLVQRARDSIVATGEPLDEEVFARFAGRLAYVHGRLRRRGHLPTGRRGHRRRGTPGVLPGDPAVPLRHRGQGAGRGQAEPGGPDRGREAVRPRPPVRPGPGRRPAPVRRRGAAVPDRPLPRKDGVRGDPLPAVRQHHPGAPLEPQLRRVRRDHHGRGLRRGRPRPLLRPRRCAPGRGGEPPDAGRHRGRDGGSVRTRATTACAMPRSRCSAP